MKSRSETAKSLHVCKIVFSDLGRSLNRLSPKVIEDLDKYLLPILSAEGIYKIEYPAEALAEADPPSLKLRRGSQFCDTFGGQNWNRTRLIDTNKIYEKHLVQSMVFFILYNNFKY